MLQAVFWKGMTVWRAEHFYQDTPRYMRGRTPNNARNYARSVDFHATEGRDWALRRKIEARSC